MVPYVCAAWRGWQCQHCLTGGETEAQHGKVAFQMSPADRARMGGWTFSSTSLLYSFGKYKGFMLSCKSVPAAFLRSLWLHAALWCQVTRSSNKNLPVKTFNVPIIQTNLSIFTWRDVAGGGHSTPCVLTMLSQWLGAVYFIPHQNTSLCYFVISLNDTK